MKRRSEFLGSFTLSRNQFLFFFLFWDVYRFLLCAEVGELL